MRSRYGCAKRDGMCLRPTPDRSEMEFPPLPPGVIPEGRALVRFWEVRGSIATPGASTLIYGGKAPK